MNFTIFKTQQQKNMRVVFVCIDGDSIPHEKFPCSLLDDSLDDVEDEEEISIPFLSSDVKDALTIIKECPEMDVSLRAKLSTRMNVLFPNDARLVRWVRRLNDDRMSNIKHVLDYFGHKNAFTFICSAEFERRVAIEKRHSKRKYVSATLDDDVVYNITNVHVDEHNVKNARGFQPCGEGSL